MKKMRVIAISCLMALALFVKAQLPDSLILFSGYVLDKDSVPIENAYLVNFRTIRYYPTNKNGFFKIWVLKGDSFMINHISFERRIIKANNNPSHQNCYLLKFEPYEIQVADIRYREIEIENFKKNMESMTFEMKINTPTYQRNTELNKYAPPSAGNQIVGINIVELITNLKTYKFRKKVEQSRR
jgi:hypothetical protein